MDTDALLLATKNTQSQVVALVAVVKANTEAFREIRLDLSQCNNQEKVQAIINKVEQALADLSLESQKIDAWVKAEPKDAAYGTVAYGQYPIAAPLNPDNPVPWPPGYTPPEMQVAEGVKAEPEPPAQTAKEPPPKAPPAKEEHPPAKKK